ncbi:MAG: cytochrome c-type biogenesis protein CcmH [Porticoccaceae bacterium]|nr:cytochrome c-type biogenesis protein CcmH [Porticoccaceae bacterium]
MRLVAVLLALCLLIAPAWAVIEIAPLSSAELEARYRVLIAEMRCPKCQNQNLADSDAPIAADLRGEIRRLLEAGYDDREIAAHLVERYGDFVLYRPAVQKNTLVLWFGPGVLAVIGLLVLVMVVRRQRRSSGLDSPPLAAAEQQQLDALLKGDEPETRE